MSHAATLRTSSVHEIDGNPLNEYQAEKAQILSGDLSVSEQAKLGQALGVDYMVVGSIDGVSAQAQSVGVALTGERRTQLVAKAKVDYRVIAMASRQVKWSGTTTLDFEVAGQSDASDIRHEIADKVAMQITVGLLENIYPIRVVSREKDQLILNQGGNSLEPGLLMDVYNPGKKLIDPYTKESLGREEILVAQIRIDRVLAKQSYASVVSGKPDLISSKAILRRLDAAGVNDLAENPLNRESKSKTLAGGGVDLGF